jgi:hypothetical protein
MELPSEDGATCVPKERLGCFDFGVSRQPFRRKTRGGFGATLLFGAWTRRSVTSSHSTDAPIVALDRDGPASTEPSPLVSVTAISVVPLTPSRPPSINANAARSYVHALSQSGRGDGHAHGADECKYNQRSHHQHWAFLPCFCHAGLKRPGPASFRWNIGQETA